MKRLLLLLLVGCGGARPAATGRPIVDWRGKTILVPEKPARIVSLVPSCTELLFAVGAGAQVVGVTQYCTYPAEAATRTKVGDLSVNFEVLKALQPDLVVTSYSLAKTSANAVESLGIPVFSVEPHDFAEIARALRLLGEITGHREEGEKAARDLESRVEAVVKRVAGKPRPTVVMELTSRIDVAVPGTYGHDVLVKAGARNAFDDLAGSLFPEISWESVVKRDPDVYITAHAETNRPPSRAGFAAMKAATRHHEVEMQWLVYPTPRLAKGLEIVAELLHGP